MSESEKPQQSRRERRAAERATGRSTHGAAKRPVWKSPVAIASAAAVLIGVVVVLGLVIARGGSDMPPVAVASELVYPEEVRDGRSLGPADAPVQILMFEDPQCPACGAWTRNTEPLVVGSYVKDGTVRLTFKDFPFLGPESFDAAVAMRAAEQLGGKFWDMHALIYGNQHGENKGALSRDRLTEMAVLLGLDKDAFVALLDDKALKDAVQAEIDEGKALGVSQTPTLVINGVPKPGVPSWDDIKKLIEEAQAA